MFSSSSTYHFSFKDQHLHFFSTSCTTDTTFFPTSYPVPDNEFDHAVLTIVCMCVCIDIECSPYMAWRLQCSCQFCNWDTYGSLYVECLHRLGLPLLYYRQICGDLIFMYQLFNGGVDMTPEDIFTLAEDGCMRGHPCKVLKPRATSSVRRSLFSIGISRNSLPAKVVCSGSVNLSKANLEPAPACTTIFLACATLRMGLVLLQYLCRYTREEESIEA